MLWCVQIGQQTYKLRAFADDVVLFVVNPLVNVIKLFEMIKQFGDLAGFYTNRDKTKMLVKTMDQHMRKVLQENLG